MYRGVQFDLVFDTKNRRTAALLLECSSYNIRTYCSIVNPSEDFISENPDRLFAKFERTGEVPYFVPEEYIGVPIDIQTAKDMIDNHREKFKTHREAREWFAQNT